MIYLVRVEDNISLTNPHKEDVKSTQIPCFFEYGRQHELIHCDGGDSSRLEIEDLSKLRQTCKNWHNTLKRTYFILKHLKFSDQQFLRVEEVVSLINPHKELAKCLEEKNEGDQQEEDEKNESDFGNLEMLSQVCRSLEDNGVAQEEEEKKEDDV
ncbi:hypothetical protein DY000_02061764 [Brassica cretica]|uniref:F-box domain-containing protein n=1 Tax=Brassica cretica TaxID=69181 RepID=A0ABQ7ARG0_BRACR|nr:hypothetical protein DY000_02061764 [Brassica cretica]